MDTLRHWLEVLVLPASTPERAGAEAVFRRLKGQEVVASLAKVWAGCPLGGVARWRGAAGADAAAVRFEVEIIKRSDEAQGFEVLPEQWAVERSFGWMNRYRRLSKDYEGHSHLARAWMLWAMIHKMLNALHPKPKRHPFRYRSL